MTIRLAQESDLPQLMAMSDAARSAPQWTQQQWLAIFHAQTPARLAWIAEHGIAEHGIAEDGVAAENQLHGMGFLVAQNGGPEWELENLAVLPAFQCQGVGRQLLATLMKHAGSLLAERILLEVRVSNLSAIRLYTGSGFRLLARRPEYYRKPVEDALILVHSFLK